MTELSHDAADPIDPAVEAALRSSADKRLDALLELVRIPSVSTLPAHREDMVTAAEWVADRFRRVGASTVEVIRTPGHPLVFGRIHEAVGAPTVLV